MIGIALTGRSRWTSVLLCSLLVACASEPVSLDARPIAALPLSKITTPVAYVHSKSFRQDLRNIEPYGNRYYMPLKIGEASDRALQAAYAQVFAEAREAGSLDETRAVADERPLVATLVPSIERFDYLNASGRIWGPFYAEIVYGFVLYNSAGARVAEWRVAGFGEFDLNRETIERRTAMPRGETAILSEAPRRAVENAAVSFIADLERFPELMRLVRNLPMVGANAPSSAQETHTVASGIEAKYPGVLTLQVELAVMPTPPEDILKDPPQTSSFLPIRLRLRNQSSHRLAITPSDAQWLPNGTTPEPISPLPGNVASALLTGRPFGMTIGVMSPGVGMLPALFAAIFSAAENERQKRELAAWTAAIESDLLGAGIVAAGAERSGILYFPRPPKAEGGMIVIPIVDLDDAKRYTVRVPLPAK